MNVQEVRVPDIGDFSDVPIIEIHVAAGDAITVDDPIITLESDKATMDVPAEIAGTVTALSVSPVALVAGLVDRPTARRPAGAP